ncbi:MAG: methylaspartate mutase subunit S [Alphaproteobacteria bacterium]
MMETDDGSLTIVTGVIGADVHCIGINIVEYGLKKSGFNVVSLGIQTPQEEFIDAAVETNASAILVSSVYGHAQLDCRGLRDKCIEAGLDDILLYVGGNLAVRSDATWEETYAAMKAMGFDRVYPPRVAIGEVIKDLRADLGLPPLPATASPADDQRGKAFP